MISWVFLKSGVGITFWVPRHPGHRDAGRPPGPWRGTSIYSLLLFIVSASLVFRSVDCPDGFATPSVSTFLFIVVCLVSPRFFVTLLVSTFRFIVFVCWFSEGCLLLFVGLVIYLFVCWFSQCFLLPHWSPRFFCVFSFFPYFIYLLLFLFLNMVSPMLFAIPQAVEICVHCPMERMVLETDLRASYYCYHIITL